jgi:hypothetical protein
MNTLNESANGKKAAFKKTNAASAATATSFAYFYPAVVPMDALFWSVFGPAARYDFENPEYAYAVSLKP